MYDSMWMWTIEKYPKLRIIDDNNFKHMILQCKNESEQENIYELFIKRKEVN